MKPLAPNSLIQNRYLVVQLIGKGGMGDVYLAVDQRLGSAIALKRTFFTEDDALKNAFEREAKTLARLRHATLPKVSDHFTEGDTQFLVMEHISGDDLGDRLEQNKKPFPLSWVLFWADQLLDALSYLHSHEPPIIHRDIKPQNLKLTNENHIVLLDFGLAKNSVGETRLSTTGDVIAYTPHYASMEQIRGTGTTAKSDIYSLSATMYQLLSNLVPPDALSRADSILNSLPDPIKPISEINPEVSVAISNVIMKGLNLSSEQRYHNAREMQTALREAYSQVQQASSAQTVAFNGDEIEAPPAAVQELKTVPFTGKSEPIGEKTAVMPLDIGMKTEVMPVDIGMKTEVMPANLDSQPQPTANLDLPIPSPDKMDATLPFVAPLVFDQVNSKPVEGDKTAVMPMDLPAPDNEKTEVMPVNIHEPIGEKTAVMPIDIASPLSEKTHDFASEIPASTQENFVTNDRTQENVVPAVSDAYAAEATVPLVVYDGPISEVSNQPTAANFVASQPTGANTENYTSQPQPAQETSVPVGAEPKKKAAGGSKMFAIIGIILGLGVIGILGAGIGLYVMKPEIFGLSTATPTPTATPQSTPSPEISPSPEPTVETVNSNTGSSNTDSANVNSSDSNTNTSTTPEITKPPGDKTTPQPTATKPLVNPTPQPSKPQPTKPPATKTPPKPSPTVCRTCPLQ